jgi:hypothetical protein
MPASLVQEPKLKLAVSEKAVSDACASFKLSVSAATQPPWIAPARSSAVSPAGCRTSHQFRQPHRGVQLTPTELSGELSYQMISGHERPEPGLGSGRSPRQSGNLAGQVCSVTDHRDGPTRSCRNGSTRWASGGQRGHYILPGGKIARMLSTPIFGLVVIDSTCASD